MAQKQQYSPMMQNYLQTKEQYKDCILLYRLGDFYEMFFEDAEEASRILDLTLTGKNCGMDERAPMCGVPFHAVDTYVAKLIAAGKKVAVCEQLSEPGGRELVRRDVVRVITPGTVMDSEILEDGKSNYLCALYFDDKMGVAFCDISSAPANLSLPNCCRPPLPRTYRSCWLPTNRRKFWQTGAQCCLPTNWIA